MDLPAGSNGCARLGRESGGGGGRFTMAGRVSGDGCCSLVVGVCGWLGAFEIWGGVGSFREGWRWRG